MGESQRKVCWSDSLDLYNKVRGHLSCKMVGGVGRIEHLRKVKTKNWCRHFEEPNKKRT